MLQIIDITLVSITKAKNLNKIPFRFAHDQEKSGLKHEASNDEVSNLMENIN